MRQELLRSVAGQRPYPELLDLRVGGELGERAGRSGSLRDDDERGQRVEAAREHAEEAQRGLVGPLGVVDHEHQRPLRCEVRAQPIQAVQRSEARVDLRRAAGQLGQQHMRREPGGPVEQLRALVGRAPA